MRWTVVLVAEMEQGQRVEQPLLSFVRDQQVVLEHLGLTLAEGKRLLQAGSATDGGRAGEATRGGLSPLLAKLAARWRYDAAPRGLRVRSRPGG